MSTEHHSQLALTAEEVLRRRAESLARETAEEEATDLTALLLFRIVGEWYAVRVSDVREIFQEYSITPVPCVPDYIRGVVNVRGEILSVSDPGRMMGLGSVSEGGETPAAIVVVHHDVATALVVDEIGDIAEVTSDAIEPPISIIDRTQAEFISATAHVGDALVGVINTQRMLEPVTSAGRH